MNARQSPFCAELPAEILDQAVAWVVRLSSGTASAADRAECEAWRAAHPMHEQAWRELEVAEDSLRVAASAGPLAVTVLERRTCSNKPARGRRTALHLLGLGVVGLVAGLLGQPLIVGERVRHATATGERRRIELADGTRLELNTGTEVEVSYSPWRRLIVLHHGEILLETGSDSAAPFGRRTFWVETVHARLEAIGTRFAVRSLSETTRLHVADGAVAIHTAHTSPAIARAGDTYVLGPAVAPVRAPAPNLDPVAWAEGALVARRMPLPDFLAELSRHGSSALHCAPSAAGLRVSGVFQLDGPDPVRRALDALAQVMPVTIRYGVGKSITVALR